MTILTITGRLSDYPDSLGKSTQDSTLGDKTVAHSVALVSSVDIAVVVSIFRACGHVLQTGTLQHILS